jgi:hypothetical protein
MSGLLHAARHGDIARMKRLLAEGANINEVNDNGSSVVASATLGVGEGSHFAALSWLLIEGGASINADVEEQLWNFIHVEVLVAEGHWGLPVRQLLPLVKVLVMLEDAPVGMLHNCSKPHAQPLRRICDLGRQYWAQLPSFLEQQRASVTAHCPLPAALQSVVVGYAATTPKNVWANGLRL